MTVTTIPRPSDRGEWLAARAPFFNASQAGALYDCHPHITLADVAAEKLAPAPPDDGPTEAMERGNRLEPVLLEWFGDRHGLRVWQNPVMYANGRLLANLDGEIVGQPGEWVEVKTTARYWDGVPEHVRWQIVAQSVASDFRRCHCVIFDASMRLNVVVIEPTDAECVDLIERVEQFMACIDMGMAPEGVTLSWDHLKALHPTADPEAVVDLDDAGLLTLVEWEQTRLARVEFRKDEDALKARVAELLGNAAEARYNGVPVVSWRNNVESHRMDWRAAALTLAEELGVSEHELIEAHTYPAPGPRVHARHSPPTEAGLMAFAEDYVPVADRIVADYVPVADRIVAFREKYPEGTLQPAEPWRIVEVAGLTFLAYTAAAYRTADDPRPGIGAAWEPCPGLSNFTRNSELQNAETSVWGRALIAVGAADAKKGVSSAEDVRNRQAEQEAHRNGPQYISAANVEKMRLACDEAGVRLGAVVEVATDGRTADPSGLLVSEIAAARDVLKALTPSPSEPT